MSIDLSSRKLARTGSSIEEFVQICEWQVMQVCVGGKPGKDDFSTDVGNSGNRFQLARMVPVAERHGLLPSDVLIRVPRGHGDLYAAKPRAATISAPPKIVMRAIMLVLR